MKTIELLQKGLDEHHAGRLDAAAAAYAAALEVEPGNVSALRCLGVLRSQQGDVQAALSLLQAAAHFAPEMPEVYNDLGSVLRQRGALEEAVRAFREAIRLQPAFAEAEFNLGLTFEALGRADDALHAYDKSLQANPLRHEARFNRAAIRFRRGQFVSAIADLKEIIAHDGRSIDVGLLLGRAYRENGSWNDAEQLYKALSVAYPDNAEILVHLATCRLVQQRYAAAERSCLQAITLDPDHAEAHFKAGVAQLHQSKATEAAEHLGRAVALRPDNADAVLHYAVALQRTGAIDKAQAGFERALDLAPDNADVHWYLADFLLLRGEYQRGWNEFEWRWRHERFMTPHWEFSQPMWNGEDIRGKTILIHPEQGFGDMLQFVRYVPMVAELGARVLLGSPPELAHLLAESIDVQGVYVSRAQLPEFDVHCPLLSLPRIFHTEVETIPARVPYLHADHQANRRWKDSFSSFVGTCNVGIIWSGNPGQEHNTHRACRLEQMKPLFAVNGARFFSLQKGAPAAQLREVTETNGVIDLSPQLSDFAETAAVMHNLDLIISTDTGPVHLAGALARPVWLLLSAIPDWRWLLGRDDSPWYPTMRLFRQGGIGKWDDLIGRVARELEAFVETRKYLQTRRGVT
jgi:tetratricopeptide (TPR) repeat protein